MPICKLRTFCNQHMVSESASASVKVRQSRLRTSCMRVCSLETSNSLSKLTSPNAYKTNHLLRYVNQCICHITPTLCLQSTVLPNQYNITKITTIMTATERTIAVQLYKDTVWPLNRFKECVRSPQICDD